MLNSLKNKKFVGEDEVLGPLCHIINMSFSTGVFPRRLKSAYIKAIYKKGEEIEQKNPNIFLFYQILVKFSRRLCLRD